MPNPIRIIKHEAVPQCGSFEVRFADGRPSRYFYWDDIPSRRLRSDQVDSETALEAAKSFAREEQRMIGCTRCDGCRWVCENHRDRPWEGPRACGCGGAGAPCPVCNQGKEPEMSPDFVPDKLVRDLD